MDSVRAAAIEAMGDRPLFSGPVALWVCFHMPRPKSHFNGKGEIKKSAPLHCPKRPDTTKLVRALEDALKGVVWHDDAQVVQISAGKFYTRAGDGFRPNASVHVVELR